MCPTFFLPCTSHPHVYIFIKKCVSVFMCLWIWSVRKFLFFISIHLFSPTANKRAAQSDGQFSFDIKEWSSLTRYTEMCSFLSFFPTFIFTAAFLVTEKNVLPAEKTAVAQWLKCCVTNRKVAVSIPAGVIGIFHWYKILPNVLWPWGRLNL